MRNRIIPSLFKADLFSDLISDKELLEKVTRKANHIVKEKTSVWYLNPKMIEEASQEQRWTDTHYMITTGPVSIEEEIENNKIKATIDQMLNSLNDVKKLTWQNI